MTEDREQMLFIEKCRVEDWRSGFTLGTSKIFHIPNGGMRTKSEAAKLKAMGVKPGVADCLLPIARGGLHGLWIEMKVKEGGRLSEAQKAFGAQVVADGYAWAVARGADEAWAIVMEYLGVEHA